MAKNASPATNSCRCAKGSSHGTKSSLGEQCSHLFQHLIRIITDIIDPHGPPMAGGVASTSQMLANQLTRAAFVAVGSALLLISGVVVTAVMDPKPQPSSGFGIFLTFATVLGLIGLVVNVVTIAAWCSRLQQTAITGQVQR